MAIIEVDGLEKTYYGDGVSTLALKGATFKIEKGEFVAIMGPSGSGKSTLLHLIGFLDKSTKGKYLFDGKQSNKYSEDEIASIRNSKMGFVFQSYNLLPRASVYENVRLPLLYSDLPESEWDSVVRETIDSVNLSLRIDYEPPQLSGGEKQRVAIARALVLKPSVIFADEPTGNLDSVSGRAVMEVLQDLNEGKGHTIILITHETYTAEHAHRIIRLLDGEIESDTKVTNRHKAKEGFQK
jgi:putative ABC transport system ATP-binding protein